MYNTNLQTARKKVLLGFERCRWTSCIGTSVRKALYLSFLQPMFPQRNPKKNLYHYIIPSTQVQARYELRPIFPFQKDEARVRFRHVFATLLTTPTQTEKERLCGLGAVWWGSSSIIKALQAVFPSFGFVNHVLLSRISARGSIVDGKRSNSLLYYLPTVCVFLPSPFRANRTPSV